MQQVQAWVAAHATLMTVLVWPLVSMCVNAVFDLVKMHAKDSPAARAVDSFFSAVGLDAGKAIAALKNLVSPPPAAPPKGPSVTEPLPSKRDALMRPPSSLEAVTTDAHEKRKFVDVNYFVGARQVFRRLPLLAALAALTGFTATGCQLLHDAVPVLNHIIGYVADAEAIISGLEQAAQLFFLAHADAQAMAEFQKADARVRASLDTISRLATAGKDLDSEDMVAAIKDFQAAYSDFATLLRSLGVNVPPAGVGTVGAHVQTEPMLMTVHTEAKK